jgi:hypothetical protein
MWNSTVGFLRKAWIKLKSLFDDDVNVDQDKSDNVIDIAPGDLGLSDLGIEASDLEASGLGASDLEASGWEETPREDAEAGDLADDLAFGDSGLDFDFDDPGLDDPGLGDPSLDAVETVLQNPDTDQDTASDLDAAFNLGDLDLSALSDEDLALDEEDIFNLETLAQRAGVDLGELNTLLNQPDTAPTTEGDADDFSDEDWGNLS